MVETYRRMLGGERPTQALRAAAGWLRALPKEEVLRRLETRLAPLEKAEAAGQWQTLPDVECFALYDRLDALRSVRWIVQDGPRRPFAHPVHWAAFAVYGA